MRSEKLLSLLFECPRPCYHDVMEAAMMALLYFCQTLVSASQVVGISAFKALFSLSELLLSNCNVLIEQCHIPIGLVVLKTGKRHLLCAWCVQQQN
jgi:hypothetical protein